MKFHLFILLTLFCKCAFCQSLQLHYDARHSVDPKRNDKNFTTLYFEYFKPGDSVKSAFKPGSFLLKMQADFLGTKSNMGKFYMQVSQSFRFWKPKIYLSLQYNGGLGIAEPKQYSYYITNTFSAGADYPFKLQKTYLSGVLDYRYTAYDKASHDLFFTLYWWRGIWKYKAEISGDFSLWTENKNHGDELTKALRGKRLLFFAEPQFWYSLNKHFSVGTKLNMYYHIIYTSHVFQIYPTAAIKCKL